MSSLPPAQPPRLEQRVLDLVREEVLQTPPGFGVQSDLFAAGLDSMAIMQLLLLLEERFAVTIGAESVKRENFQTARSIAALLVERGCPADAVVEGPDLEASPESPSTVEPAAAPTYLGDLGHGKHFHRLPLTPCDFFVVAFDDMLYSAGQIGHIAHSIIDLDHVPDVAALRKVIAELPSRFPMLNAKLHQRWALDLPAWQSADQVLPLGFYLWSAEGSPGVLKAEGAQSFTELQPLLEEVINAPLPRYNEGWVNARFDLVEKQDGGAVFVFSWSHLIMDGVGAEHFLSEMARMMGGPGVPIPAFDLEEDDRSVRERWESAKPVPQVFQKLMAQPIDALGPRRLTPGKTRFQVITLTAEQTAEAARRSAAVSGPLINMPFHLACAMRAHYRVFQHRGKTPRGLMCSVPVQLRRKGVPGPIFQNQLTMFFAAARAEDLVTLDATTRSIQEQHTRFLKDKLGEGFRDLMWLMRPMPPRLHMKFIHWQMKGLFSSFYHSHTGPFAPDLKEFGGAAITNAYHVPGISNPPGTGIFVNERDGKLVLTLCWRDGAMTEEERAVFVKELTDDVYGQAS